MPGRPAFAPNQKQLTESVIGSSFRVSNVTSRLYDGPAQGLPDTKVGTFAQDLYDEGKQEAWTVISMKNDWKRIFAFEN